MLRMELHEGWTARVVGHADEAPPEVRDREIAAPVPGTVHAALLDAGLIDDPYFGDNETKIQWIKHVGWQYRCTFTPGSGLLDEERVELVCEGLDTIATVELNGVEVGRSQTMHAAYRFDVREALKQGANELVITFESADRYARQWEAKLGTLPFTPQGRENATPFNFVRKMACNFGWDWGPDLATAGIWKPIRLEAPRHGFTTPRPRASHSRSRSTANPAASSARFTPRLPTTPAGRSATPTSSRPTPATRWASRSCSRTRICGGRTGTGSSRCTR